MIVTFISKLAHAVARKNSYRLTNIVCIYCILSLPLLFVATISFSSIYKHSIHLSLSQERNAVFPVALTLANRINQVVDSGKGIVINPQVRELMSTGKWNEVMDVIKIYYHISDEPFIDRIVLLNPEGVLMSGIPETRMVGQDFSYRDWYKGVVKTGKPYVSDVYLRAIQPQYNVVSVSLPVTDEQNLLSGILMLQIRIDHFLNWIQSIDVGAEGIIYIVDQYGNIVAHPNVMPKEAIVSLSDYPIVQSLMEGNGGQEISFDPLHPEERVLSSYEPVPQFGWGVVIQQSFSSAFSLKQKTITSLLWVYGFVLLLNMVVIYIIVSIFAHYQDHKDIRLNPKPFKPTKL